MTSYHVLGILYTTAKLIGALKWPEEGVWFWARAGRGAEPPFVAGCGGFRIFAVELKRWPRGVTAMNPLFPIPQKGEDLISIFTWDTWFLSVILASRFHRWATTCRWKRPVAIERKGVTESTFRTVDLSLGFLLSVFLPDLLHNHMQRETNR